MDLGNGKVLSQQVGQRALLEPFPVQAPLAARRQQPIRHQHEQHVVPARALAAGRKPLRPEPVKLQLPPQRQRQPARSPLPRPHQPHLRQPQAHDGGVRNEPVATVLGKQRQRPWPRAALLDDLDRLAPRQLLAVVDLA